MPLSDSDLNSLVVSPSLGGVIYQARTLIDELKKINDEEFPRETLLVREVFLCLAEHILEELKGMSNPERPFELGPDDPTRIRSLAEILREFHSYIRYLWASSPRQSPPAVQTALVELTKLHFPKEHGDPVCIVRPQWTYNLKFVPLMQELKKIRRSVLDFHGRLGVQRTEQIISALWEKRLEKLRGAGKEPLAERAPEQIGVLSFAAIDTPDAFLLPLLGHELAHFLAYSPPRPLHKDPELMRATTISEDTVKTLIRDTTGKYPGPGEVKFWGILCNQTWTCLRELLADLIATRMLGLSFFLAQARFLKSLSPWLKPRILLEEYGYPAIHFRLSLILRHLTADDYPGNPLTFLPGHSGTHSGVTEPLIKYLETWRQHLEAQPDIVPKKTEIFGELLTEPFYRLVENAVNNPDTIDILSRIAKRVIPDERCARLGATFFERIARLEQDLPPSVPEENSNSFSEIMSASWAYQVIYGEARETERTQAGSRFDEHSKTSNLMIKAIELIPANQPATGAGAVPVAGHTSPEGPAPKTEDLPGRTGVLSAAEIRRRATLEITDPSHIHISPLRVDAIKGASLDVRLGNWFAYARRTKLGGIKLGDEKEEELLKLVGQREAFIPIDKAFLLHPGDLALGVTQEFIALPKDVMAFVEGRSGLGRLGLFVATATQVAPGFHGVVVLELANAGTVPLELKPGIEIAQLIFQTMTDPVPDDKLYRGKYYCQIKPLT